MGHPLIAALRQLPASYHPGWGDLEYTSWQDEQLSWKTTCYLGDWSFLWDLQVDGPDALRLFRDTSVNGYDNFAIGTGKHMIQCNEAGKVNAEGVLLRLGEQSFATQSTTAVYTAFMATAGGYDVTLSYDRRFQLQVSGPDALAVCEEAAGENLRDIKFMGFRTVTVAGVEVLALRQGMAGEIGFELHGPLDARETVSDHVLAVGEKYGIRRLGRRTAMINHLEAAFPTGNWHFLCNIPEGFVEFAPAHFDMMGLGISVRGSLDSDDLDDYMLSPVSLGWAKSIKFDHEFIGREALEKEVADPKFTRVTLELNNDDVIDVYASLFDEEETYSFMDLPHQQRWYFHADAVLDSSGQRIGISTPPGYSYFFRKVLTLGFVRPDLAVPGTSVHVLWGDPGTRQKLIRATVAPAPYKQDRRRDALNQQSAPALASATRV